MKNVAEMPILTKLALITSIRKILSEDDVFEFIG